MHSLQPSGEKNGSIEQSFGRFTTSLPYVTFGNHLDSQGRTIEVELEKRNFKKAGEVLGKAWKELLINKFPVVCQYLENSTMEPVPYEESWVSKHCCILQYFLQIVKCTNDKCCGPFHTNWLRIFPNQFLPAPIQFRQDPGGPTVQAGQFLENPGKRNLSWKVLEKYKFW